MTHPNSQNSVSVSLAAGTHWLCSCGLSKNFPYCDDGHKGTPFQPLALGLFPILLVAMFKVHGANGWLFTNQGGGWEFPACLRWQSLPEVIACLVQFLLGDGAFAIGAVLSHKRA